MVKIGYVFLLLGLQFEFCVLGFLYDRLLEANLVDINFKN